MQFLESNQIEEWCRENGIAPLNRKNAPVVMSRNFGQTVTPQGQEAEVSEAVVMALGDWDECLLWIRQWGIWPSSEDWPKFYAERGAQGERRSLHTFLTTNTSTFSRSSSPVILSWRSAVGA